MLTMLQTVYGKAHAGTPLVCRNGCCLNFKKTNSSFSFSFLNLSLYVCLWCCFSWWRGNLRPSPHFRHPWSLHFYFWGYSDRNFLNHSCSSLVLIKVLKTILLAALIVKNSKHAILHLRPFWLWMIKLAHNKPSFIKTQYKKKVFSVMEFRGNWDRFGSPCQLQDSHCRMTSLTGVSCFWRISLSLHQI